MNEDLKRVYLAIRKIAPLWPAHKALKSAKESILAINKILTS